ncbi:MAG: ferrous iron transport protein A [Tepidanaerobacter acetatoxydans]|uniref:FeoA family protein n=1 Tax=Tepidanaerobacter acetatoxydans TaxID=499229 RepID=UPI0026ECE21A|nr:FeoA family protein [Tepidanaerobacter acetatoxydans]NLU10272.1 ferrous iron transport protein A [Tepidanaerobacter acetatoxydans]
MNISLDNIPIGQTVKVKGISDGSIKRRLMDMGIVPGLEISVEGRAPLGDPIEILVRGYKLTLRKNEAQSILVEKEVE